MIIKEMYVETREEMESMLTSPSERIQFFSDSIHTFPCTITNAKIENGVFLHGSFSIERTYFPKHESLA